MSPEPYASISRLLVRLLSRRIHEEWEEIKAAALLEDLGEDDCPICLANRRRESFVNRSPVR